MQGRMFPRVNTSRNQLKIKKKLEELGHENVEVWWEPVSGVYEMGGYDGGFFFSSKENVIESIGYSFAEAIEYVESVFDIRE